MDMEFFSKQLGKSLGKGLSITVSGPNVIQFMRPMSNDPRPPFFKKVLMDKKTTEEYEVFEVNSESLSGEKWFAHPHSGFQHDPVSKEIWYFYCGELWVLKPKEDKLVLFERK